MAVTCTAAGLVSAGACFTQQNFSAKDQKAILAYLWWKWGDSAQNRETTTAQQISAATCLAQSMSKDQLAASQIAVMNIAINGGGFVSLAITISVVTAAQAATSIACFKNVSGDVLDAMIVYNMCRFFGGAS